MSLVIENTLYDIFAMDSFTQTKEKEALKILEAIPQRIGRLQKFIVDHFPEQSASKYYAQFLTAIDVSKPTQLNAKVEELMRVVADELETVLLTLRNLMLWIQLRVPKISDGNNFGVEVQKFVFTHLKESIEQWKKVWDALPEYHNQRANAIEKIKDKKQTEKSVTTTQCQSNGKKEGDISYKEVQQIDKDFYASSTILPDWVSYIAAVDTKWYLDLKYNLFEIVAQYAVTNDIITKNKDKILFPRGSDTSSFNFY